MFHFAFGLINTQGFMREDNWTNGRRNKWKTYRTGKCMARAGQWKGHIAWRHCTSPLPQKRWSSPRKKGWTRDRRRNAGADETVMRSSLSKDFCSALAWGRSSNSSRWVSNSKQSIFQKINKIKVQFTARWYCLPIFLTTLSTRKHNGSCLTKIRRDFTFLPKSNGLTSINI